MTATDTLTPPPFQEPVYWIVFAEWSEGLQREWHPVKLLPELPLWRLEEVLDGIENCLPNGWGRLRLQRIR